MEYRKSDPDGMKTKHGLIGLKHWWGSEDRAGKCKCKAGDMMEWSKGKTGEIS